MEERGARVSVLPRMIEVVRDRKSGIHCCCLEGCLRVSLSYWVGKGKQSNTYSTRLLLLAYKRARKEEEGVRSFQCALCTSSGQAPVVEPLPTLSVDTHFYFLFSHLRHIIPPLIPSSPPIIRKKLKETDQTGSFEA
ncbi:hypothetical protein QQG55_7500 [Brugia pahangi]|uniref:Uncharacterized protein n=2 Tax=Brugia TaxID=6278 RepID=A0A0N4TLT5_BRUPA|nr:unnamed protein product [Brugia pahangi]